MGQTGQRSIATHILAVKIALGRLHFHGFGVARQGPWVTWVNKSHKKRSGSAPNPVATALSRARSKTRTASLTATPAYHLRLGLGTRGWVNEDRTFGRVHHLCGDAPQSHPSDYPEIPAAHGQ